MLCIDDEEIGTLGFPLKPGQKAKTGTLSVVFVQGEQDDPLKGGAIPFCCCFVYPNRSKGEASLRALLSIRVAAAVLHASLMECARVRCLALSL